MTLNISLSPESEARLRARAAAQGKDVAAYVRETIEESLADDDTGNAPRLESPAQGTPQWFARFNEWAASHPPRPSLADDGRDAIYSEEPD